MFNNYSIHTTRWQSSLDMIRAELWKESLVGKKGWWKITINTKTKYIIQITYVNEGWVNCHETAVNNNIKFFLCISERTSYLPNNPSPSNKNKHKRCKTKPLKDFFSLQSINVSQETIRPIFVFYYPIQS